MKALANEKMKKKGHKKCSSAAKIESKVLRLFFVVASFVSRFFFFQSLFKRFPLAGHPFCDAVYLFFSLCSLLDFNGVYKTALKRKKKKYYVVVYRWAHRVDDEKRKRKRKIFKVPIACANYFFPFFSLRLSQNILAFVKGKKLRKM